MMFASDVTSSCGPPPPTPERAPVRGFRAGEIFVQSAVAVFAGAQSGLSALLVVPKEQHRRMLLGKSEAGDSAVDAEAEVDFEEGDSNNATNIQVLNGSARIGLDPTAEHFDNNSGRGNTYRYIGKMLPETAFLSVLSKNKVPASLNIVVYGPSFIQSQEF